MGGEVAAAALLRVARAAAGDLAPALVGLAAPPPGAVAAAVEATAAWRAVSASREAAAVLLSEAELTLGEAVAAAAVAVAVARKPAAMTAIADYELHSPHLPSAHSGC